MRPPEKGSGHDGAGHPDYRFTLANERTLLAWLRTGLALVAGGGAAAAYAPALRARRRRRRAPIPGPAGAPRARPSRWCSSAWARRWGATTVGEPTRRRSRRTPRCRCLGW